MEGLSKNNGGGPAGSATHAVGQQPEGVLVVNARDQRVVQWLCEQVGKEAVEEASKDLGGRHTYPSNIAKLLGLKPPENLQFTERDVARDHLSKAKAILRRTKGAPE